MLACKHSHADIVEGSEPAITGGRRVGLICRHLSFFRSQVSWHLYRLQNQVLPEHLAPTCSNNPPTTVSSVSWATPHVRSALRILPTDLAMRAGIEYG